MSDPTLTETEKSIQNVLCARRDRGYGVRETLTYKESPVDLGYRVDAAFRGGPVWSPIGRFDANQMVEWAMAVLDHLSDQRVEMPRKVHEFGCEDGWDQAKAEIIRIFDKTVREARGDMAGERGDLGDVAFADQFPGITTQDPWAFGILEGCQWFLDHMSKFVIFSVWQTVHDAMEDAMAEHLSQWALKATHNDPRQIAASRFDDAMANLNDHIKAAIKAD